MLHGASWPPAHNGTMWSICQPGQCGIGSPVAGHGVLDAKARLALLLRGDGCALARVKMASVARAALIQGLGIHTASGAGEHRALAVSGGVDDDAYGYRDQACNPMHKQHHEGAREDEQP